MEAIKLAGLKLRMLLSEPVAALLGYRDLDPSANQNALVFDLGGGTLDCTIIRIADGESQVLAKRGGMDIAGDRIDQYILEEVLERLKREKGVTLAADDLHARQTLWHECRKTRERLYEKD